MTNSEHTRTEFAREFGFPLGRTFAAPLGLGNLGPRIEAPDPAVLAGLGVAGPFVFALSTLEPRKNFPRLLEAWAMVKDRPELAGTRLVVGGGKGWKEGPVFERLRRLGLEGDVHFAGYVPDTAVGHLFAGCRGFVLPSLVEGFGITVLEAMHYGAPVACAATGSLPEVGGNLPVYFDPTDAGDMARALVALVALPDRAARVARGIARAGEFSWERNVATVLERIEGFRR